MAKPTRAWDVGHHPKLEVEGFAPDPNDSVPAPLGQLARA